jgi:tRNA nucleotidyltransferase/poly(A) polymerase
MVDLLLSPEQEAEAQRLAALIGLKAQEDALRMTRILVSKLDAQLLGATEFEVRDRAHDLAAHAIETAVNRRKKGGIRQ